MNCKCGGSTHDKPIVRGKKRVAELRCCSDCGRVRWLWLDKGWTKQEIRETARNL